MMISFRGGFFGGLAIALCIGLYLHLALASRSIRSGFTPKIFFTPSSTETGKLSPILLSDYQDQWGDDKTRLLERMREGFRWVRGSRIIASNPAVQVEMRRAIWIGKITVYSSDDGVMEVLDERVNKLPAPFELEWHRLSGKPWDWKLVRVSNSAFEIPADVY